MEEWKEIHNHPNYYVSNFGNVKKVNAKNGTEKLIRGDLNSTGYRRVQFTLEGELRRYFVHRLVAIEFLPNPQNFPVVNHKDGNKLNCNASNLEWTTQSKNADHAFDMGLRMVGEGSTNAETTNEIVEGVCRLIQAGWVRGSVLALGLDGITKSKFDDIRRRKTWKRISCRYKW